MFPTNSSCVKITQQDANIFSQAHHKISLSMQMDAAKEYAQPNALSATL
jgi:hypothetical protein